MIPRVTPFIWAINDAFIFQGERVLRLKDAKPRNLMETTGTIGAMTQPQGAPWVVFWVHLGPCKIACFKTMYTDCPLFLLECADGGWFHLQVGDLGIAFRQLGALLVHGSFPGLQRCLRLLQGIPNMFEN